MIIFMFSWAVHEQMGYNLGACLCHTRIIMVLIRLCCIRAVWSAPLCFDAWIVDTSCYNAAVPNHFLRVRIVGAVDFPMPLVRLEYGTTRPEVEHSTNEQLNHCPPHPLIMFVNIYIQASPKWYLKLRMLVWVLAEDCLLNRTCLPTFRSIVSSDVMNIYILQRCHD